MAAPGSVGRRCRSRAACDSVPRRCWGNRALTGSLGHTGRYRVRYPGGMVGWTSAVVSGLAVWRGRRLRVLKGTNQSNKRPIVTELTCGSRAFIYISLTSWMKVFTVPAYTSCK